jgi:hypothetical protein
MAAQRSIIEYKDFSGGEFDDHGAYNAPPNSWTGLNMLVYKDGSLGVRPGLYNFTPSAPAPAVGLVHGFGGIGVPSADVWYIQGTATRVFGTDGTALVTVTGALAEIPSMPVDSVAHTNKVIISSEADKLYRLDTTVASPYTMTALTGSPGAMCVTVYGDRIIAGDIDGSFEYRVRFSAAADINSWPAANFFDVGDGWGVKALFPQRQHLAVIKQTTYNAVTGVPGVNAILRSIATDVGPYHPLHANMTADMVAVLPGDQTYPALWDGTRLHIAYHLKSHLTASRTTAIPASHGVTFTNIDGPDFYFFQNDGDKAIAYQNRVWSYHTFGVNISGYVNKQAHGQYVYICDGGSAIAAPKFYYWNPNASSPGIEGGDRMRAGDDSSTALTGRFSLPEWHSPDGDEFVVRSVVVDFRKWNTGSATTNHFDLKVSTMRTYQGTTADSNTVSFDEAAASSSSTGTLQRNVFGFGEQQMGNGFQLHFTNCRGVAFHRIQVVLERRPVRV